MARVLSPAGWTILAVGGLAIYLAGRDMNRATTVVQVQGYPMAYPWYFRYNHWFGAGGRRRRSRPPEQPEQPPESAENANAGVPGLPPIVPTEPTVTPGADVATPPYSSAVVQSTLVPQAAPNIQYITAGENDNLYTMSMRLYNTPMRSMDIFNANRVDTVRADGTPGIMAAPDFVQPGTQLIIPGGQV